MTERLFRIGSPSFFEQPIASSMRDRSRCTSPIRVYQWSRSGSRGLSRIACSASGIISSIDPALNLLRPSCA